MAAKRASSGLSIGQLFTLTFGFLLASVAIFVLGLWVGRDLAKRRQQNDEQVMRIAVDPTPAPTAAPADGAPSAGFDAPFAAAAPTASHTPPEVPTAIREEQTAIPRSTNTVRATEVPRLPPTPGRAVIERGGSQWTIQVTATNDQVQALVQAQRLRSKGFDAYTVQTEIGGATWYRVQAGKYGREADAQADARKLRAQGFEAAFVSALR